MGDRASSSHKKPRAVAYGQRLAHLRALAGGITTERLASQSGVSVDTIKHAEAGLRYPSQFTRSTLEQTLRDLTSPRVLVQESVRTALDRLEAAAATDCPQCRAAITAAVHDLRWVIGV